MNYIFSVLMFISNLSVMVIFESSNSSSIGHWYTVNDNVMGGVSQSDIAIHENGNAVFEGSVSLQNNGGFCSVRYNNEKINAAGYEKVTFRIKGDGKRYQFRIKTDQRDSFSYTTWFNTSGDWETIEILLKDMYPVFRGRKLDMPNFSQNKISEFGFLIGNKKEETFRLEIDKIELK
jgi:NADH dehydrogenase [ubiquinone] 1 alpha subcomplex assembly factor 1